MFGRIKIACAVGCMVVLSACATTNSNPSDSFNEKRGSVKVLLMEPDVEMRYVTLGSQELRADWTEAALENFRGSIISQLKSTGEDVVEFKEISATVGDVEQLLLLNEQVAEAMGQHFVMIGAVPFKGRLPHKTDDNRMSYTLGDRAKVLKSSSGADYAAFLTSRSVIESGGSIFAKIAIGVVTGYAPALSGFRGAYVSLVDLDTGEVVWLKANLASAFAGDPRSKENTDAVIGKLMKNSPFKDDAVSDSEQ